MLIKFSYLIKSSNQGLVYNYDGNVSDANLTYTSIGYANGPGGGKIRLKNLTDAEVGTY